MSSKIFNREVVRLAVCSEFWKKEFSNLFAPEFEIKFPSAPPGMPQYMDGFDVNLYFEWLDATVKNWQVTLEELYGTPDPNIFWAVSKVSGDVTWGGQNGKYENKLFAMFRLRDGKIIHLKEVSNPLKYLEAAGRECPTFRMDLYHKKIEKMLADERKDAHNAPGSENLDLSKDAIQKRIADNLRALTRDNYWSVISNMTSYAPEFETVVWFLPPEMKESYPPELMDRVEAWSVLSCPIINFDSRGKCWETDDPHVYFCEYMCSGIVDWLGNDCPDSRYRNRYFYILRFNDKGQIKKCEEVLNPINKYNSINVSIPTFPYYY